MAVYSKVIHNPKPPESPPNLNPVFKITILLRLRAMRTVDFNYELPPELIAQHPANKRDESRLLVLHRKENRVEHRQFRDLLEFLRAGDVLVLNNSRVIPARLRGTNAKSGGKFEMLLIEENATNDWWTMIRPGKKARIGTQIILCDANGQPTKITATVLAANSECHRRLKFSGANNLRDELDPLGEMPLPPYIHRDEKLAEDKNRYQTVFAKTDGSVAAPTAGLHFTPELLEQVRELGVKICFVTLHVGLGTFLPVKSENLAGHKMHEEQFEIGEETVRAVNDAKKSGNRVIAVGTTTVRVLETVAARNAGKLNVYAGKTDIFIFQPFDFKIVDALLTNFHLPCSTLLMLVSAFAAPNEIRGREMILSAYGEAIHARYRFFSYGDAMLIL
ncbi:MAG TPA: tRNA preQ1(34) S-adenosylmethionine ribosyltransferase-isomerase QueA [Dongiaceae bacterium]|jgi:S-adenosylmethionine:tRNA ribosyltransferase-isomerase|nr:tRNA preQ1(34) S-adenosylmethionine ribosyltransferase-isomerase QueA [Dongiaceae bacterium]